MFSKKSLLIFVVGVIACTAWWLAASQFQASNQTATVSFLNVGQGDAILIESTTNETVLIDTGPDSRVVYELSKALTTNDTTIETLVLTHSDADHTGGALAVLNHYDVEKILVSGLKNTAQLSQKIADTIARKKIPLIPVAAGTTFTFENGERDGLFEVLYPFKPVMYSSEKANNDSVVMRLLFNSHSFLFTGDIEKEVEEKLVAAYPDGELRAEALKLAHHGSKTSSTEGFLRAVNPKTAIASVGQKNKFGHPNAEVLERLKALKIPLRRTDLEGRITFTLE